MGLAVAAPTLRDTAIPGTFEFCFQIRIGPTKLSEDCKRTGSTCPGNNPR